MIRDVNIRRHNARVTNVNIKQCACTLLVFHEASKRTIPRQPIRGLAWCHRMRKRIILLSPSFPLAHAHRRYSNQVYKWKWIALYTFCAYVRILDRILALNIPSDEGWQSDEAAFVWTFDSLDWVFRDIIIYVDDWRLVCNNCCYFLNVVLEYGHCIRSS